MSSSSPSSSSDQRRRSPNKSDYYDDTPALRPSLLKRTSSNPQGAYQQWLQNRYNAQYREPQKPANYYEDLNNRALSRSSSLRERPTSQHYQQGYQQSSHYGAPGQGHVEELHRSPSHQYPHGQYQPQGHPSQYQLQGHPDQYQIQGHPGQYQPQGHPGQYQIQGHPGQYQIQGHPGQYQPHGHLYQYQPQGQTEMNNHGYHHEHQSNVHQKQPYGPTTYLPQPHQYEANPGVALIVDLPTTSPVLPPLPSTPATLTCPVCQHVVRTDVKYKSSARTHISAILCCLIFLPLVCLPYCIKECKKPNHTCPNCASLLGTAK